MTKEYVVVVTHLIKMKTPYLQCEFSESTKEKFAKSFLLSDHENLLCGVWTSLVFRDGFAITDKNLFWHFKTKDGVKTGKISKEEANDIEFVISPYISSENSQTSQADSIAEECSKLEIRSNGRTETFYITGLTEEKGKTFCDILKFGFTQGEVPKIDLGELVKKLPLLPLRTFFDEISNLADSASENFQKYMEYLAKGFYEITHIKFKLKSTVEAENASKTKQSASQENKTSEHENQTETNQDSKKAEEPENLTTESQEEKTEPQQKPSKKHNKLFSFVLNLFDVAASLLFIASIVNLLKPELFKKFSDFTVNFSQIAFSGYIVLKCCIAFYSKKTVRKIISIILVVISILSYILFTYTKNNPQPNESGLLVFISITLCLLSYFAFEFSCGVTAKGLFKKILFIIVLSFVLYVTAHFAIYDKKTKLIKAARKFGQELSLFIDTL